MRTGVIDREWARFAVADAEAVRFDAHRAQRAGLEIGDEADTVPGTVLDPFVGSGTTLLVAREMKRNAIGLELSESYVRLAERRLGLAAVPLL